MEEIIDKERTTIESRGHNTGRGGDELNQTNLQNKTRNGATARASKDYYLEQQELAKTMTNYYYLKQNGGLRRYRHVTRLPNRQEITRYYWEKIKTTKMDNYWMNPVKSTGYNITDSNNFFSNYLILS